MTNQEKIESAIAGCNDYYCGSASCGCHGIVVDAYRDLRAQLARQTADNAPQAAQLEQLLRRAEKAKADNAALEAAVALANEMVRVLARQRDEERMLRDTMQTAAELESKRADQLSVSLNKALKDKFAILAEVRAYMRPTAQRMSSREQLRKMLNDYEDEI